MKVKESIMRFFILSLMAIWALNLVSPPATMAEPFLSPFAKHGVYDPRIAAYMPPFKKKLPPLHWRHGSYLFPYNCPDNCARHEKNRTRPAPKTTYKKPLVLNPDIFNPTPKTPLTLVIKDGVVVDSYRGYEKKAGHE
jgi:hypothetical protein